MAYIVTEDCIQCKHTDCVSVCPVDCFHEGENFLAIDPDECIDCGACEPECPLRAIKPHDQLSEADRQFVALNRDLAQSWPAIFERKSSLPDAARWAGVPGKLAQLVR
ncbi:ferredoxin family protein [Oxalobacteraceae bacterium]|nr:ferredoxin family protein [Oxalobacteraceae bacterium]